MYKLGRRNKMCNHIYKYFAIMGDCFHLESTSQLFIELWLSGIYTFKISRLSWYLQSTQNTQKGSTTHFNFNIKLWMYGQFDIFLNLCANVPKINFDNSQRYQFFFKKFRLIISRLGSAPDKIGVCFSLAGTAYQT